MVDQMLWLTWYGVALDAHGGQLMPGVPAGDLNPVRVLLNPLTWEQWPDRSGWFNRISIRIPEAVVPGRTLLHGYRIHTEESEVGEPYWLPFRAPTLFEERLPLLPPGALQLRPGAMQCVPSWRVFGADRNPAPRWEHRMSLYADPEKPYLLTTQLYFDQTWRLLSAQSLNVPAKEHLNGHPEHRAHSQTTRMWVAFEH